MGDVQLGQGVELVGGLDEGGGLLGDGVHHHRGAVAEVVHGPAGDEVDVLFAVGVPDAGAIAADDDHRAAADGLGVVLLLDGDVFGVAGHRTWAPWGVNPVGVLPAGRGGRRLPVEVIIRYFAGGGVGMGERRRRFQSGRHSGTTSSSRPNIVIPAEAGIYRHCCLFRPH